MNLQWTVHVIDNQSKDKFMKDTFAGIIVLLDCKFLLHAHCEFFHHRYMLLRVICEHQQFCIGTSLLWAYNNINPRYGGAAKADIWRFVKHD